MDRPFPLSVTACVLDLDTDTSRPGSRANDVPGLADQKDTDRLMDIMHARTDSALPRPALCPICGQVADNGIPRRSEITTLVTYVCTNGHLFAVTWVEVA